jgi:hypothetical protein
MIPRIARAIFCSALIVAGAAPPVCAQLSGNLGALTAENAKGYLGPLPKALSGTLNAAVFQTGRVPKTGINFTVGVRLMGVSFDDKDRTYSPTPPPGFTPTEDVAAPTIIGDLNAVSQSGQGGTVLYHPSGFDTDNFAIAVPQLEIGAIAGTRAIVRWISLDVGDSDFGKLDLLGIGGQHSLSQYLPGFPVDLAAGVMWQKFQIGDDLVDVKTLQFNVTGSRKFMVFEPYVGVGFDKLDMKSKYESTTSTPPTKLEF